MVSFFEWMCSCNAFLEYLWLILSSIQIVIVPLGSFVSTLWMVRLYTEEICSFRWLCGLYVTIRGLLPLIVAKMTPSLNKMCFRKGPAGVLWRTLFSILCSIAVLTWFTWTFASMGVYNAELWPCGWPLPELRSALSCNTFSNSTMMRFLLCCWMYITINGIITKGMAMMRSSFEWIWSCQVLFQLQRRTLISVLTVIIPFGSFVLTLEMLGLYAEEKYHFIWLCRLCITIGGLLVFSVAKITILPSLSIVWTPFQRFTTECVVAPDSRLYLLLRARVIIGIKRISRMSYSELLQIHNSHAPLFDLETKRGGLSSNKLSELLREASLQELSYLYDASEIITRNVEHVLSQNPKYVKLQQRWGKIRDEYDQGKFELRTIDRFQVVLLVLSLFESSNEGIRTVILYGVPGLPSLTVSVSATYAEIRSIILRVAPSFSEFYFVARGRIITIEDTVIDWGSGHLVLDVRSCGDLPGGSKRSFR